MNKLIVIFALTSASSFGQKDLSATDAVVIALENNYQILIAEKQHEINEMNNSWSEAGLFPTVDLSIAQSNNLQDNTQNPFTFTPGKILSQGLNPSLSLNWNIFSGFAVKISKQRLEQLETQSANNAMTIIEGTIQDVLKAYFTAQLQNERLELFNSVLTLSRDRYEYYLLKEKYSTASSLESLQFRNQYLTDSTNFLMQKISSDNAMRNLLILMNQDDSTSLESNYTLIDKLSFDIQSINFEDAQNEMLSENTNLRAQYIGLELQKTATSLQRSFLYPTLSFQAGVQPNWSKIRNLDDPAFSAEPYTLSYYGNFNLRYTLFNNWKNKRAVEVSAIQEDISELNIESMKKTLSSTLMNLIELHEVRTQLVGISTVNLNYAKQAFDLAEKRYDLGSMNSIDLATFQNTYENTMIQHYENLFNRLDTYLEIYKMTGKLRLSYTKD
ncbi:MAG: TolC family protein [Crocinitomicaceae bacterium]|nr:TolC family protein [Crocinitomicaceae bacterium]